MGLSRTAVYLLLKDGLLKAVRRGKRIIIPRTEIPAYLDSHAAEVPAVLRESEPETQRPCGFAREPRALQRL